jgi:hypothetical protein
MPAEQFQVNGEPLLSEHQCIAKLARAEHGLSQMVEHGGCDEVIGAE